MKLTDMTPVPGSYGPAASTRSSCVVPLRSPPSAVMKSPKVVYTWNCQLERCPIAKIMWDAAVFGTKDSPALTLLRARLDLAQGRFDVVRAWLGRRNLATMRDRLTGELLLARAAIESGDDAGKHVRRAVELAAPEHLVRVFFEEGAVVTRLARAAAESIGTEYGTSLAEALGTPPRSRGTASPSTAILTERELSVLRYLPSRLTNAEIARECFMSVNTVKAHLKSIYAKLGVSSRAQTVERAGQLGLLL